MKVFATILTLIICVNGVCQGPQSLPTIDTSKASVEYWNKWTGDLYDMGVSTNKDSFFVRGEVMKVLSDSAYREKLYPEKYQWPVVVELMNSMELKKAFWYLINLYQTDVSRRNMIIGTIVTY